MTDLHTMIINGYITVHHNIASSYIIGILLSIYNVMHRCIKSKMAYFLSLLLLVHVVRTQLPTACKPRRDLGQHPSNDSVSNSTNEIPVV